MTIREFIRATAHLMAPTGISYRGHGTVKFVTPDDRTASALETVARNAALTVVCTTTDAGNHVVSASAFDDGEQ